MGRSWPGMRVRRQQLVLPWDGRRGNTASNGKIRGTSDGNELSAVPFLYRSDHFFPYRVSTRGALDSVQEKRYFEQKLFLINMPPNATELIRQTLYPVSIFFFCLDSPGSPKVHRANCPNGVQNSTWHIATAAPLSCLAGSDVVDQGLCRFSVSTPR